MSTSLWQILIGGIIGVHGIGHVLFLVPTLGLGDWGVSTRSWLLSSRIGERATRMIGAIIWLAAIIAFAVATAGVFLHTPWWRAWAIGSSVVSAVGIVLFWAKPIASSAFIALLVDLGLVVSLALFHWPPAALVGS